MEKIKKNPIKRLIALWVALALIIVPLATYVGERVGTKAAATETGSINFDFAGASLNLAGDESGMQGGKPYVVLSTLLNKELYYFDKAEITLGTNATTVGDYTVGGWEFVVTTEQIGEYGYCSNPSIDTSKVRGNKKFNIEKSDKDNSFYIYVRPYDVSGTEGPVTATFGYTLIAVYKAVLSNSFSSSTKIAWDKPEGTAVKSSTLTITGAPSDYVGPIKYGYLRSGESNIEWSTEKPTVGKVSDDVSTGDGEYTGYLGYFATDSSTSPLFKIETEKKVLVDSSAPTVSVKVMDASNNVLSPASDGNVYVDKGTTGYKYQLEIKDATSATAAYSITTSPVTTNTVNLTESDGNQKKNDVTKPEAYVPAPLVADGSDHLNITLKDDLGNVATYGGFIPRVVEVDRAIRFTEVPALDTSVDLSTGFTNKNVKINFKAESGKYINLVKVDTGAGYVDYYVSSAQNPITGNWEYTSSIQIPKDATTNYLDVNNIKVQVFDQSNEHTDEASLTVNYKFDNKKPVSDYQNDTVLTEKIGTEDYKEIPRGDGRVQTWGNKNHIVLSKDSSYQYRYFVKFTDAGVGVDKVEGCYNATFPTEAERALSGAPTVYTFTKVTTAPAWDTSSLDWYYCDVKKLDLTDEYKDFYIEATDKAGNKEKRDFNLMLKMPDNGFEFESAKLTTKNGQVVDILSQSVDDETNQPYVLTVSASSSNPITKAYIEDLNEVIPAGMSKTFTVSDNDKNDSSQKYSVEFTFEIPAGSSLNTLFDGLKVCVKDFDEDAPVGSQERVIKKLVGTILYDATKPVIKKQSGENLTTETSWYRSYDLAVKVTSGAQALESNIVDASYEITNSKGDKSDNFTDIVDGVAKATIQLPESLTPEGTKVTFTAHDNAGNALESGNVEVVCIDKTAPDVSTIKVNGVQNNLIPVGGAPVITVGAVDNLAIQKIDVTVIDPLGNEMYKTFTYGATDALAVDGKANATGEYKLSVPSGMKKLVDGEYTIKAQVIDKAGNLSATMQSKFKMDTTAPELTAKVASGTPGGKVPNLNFDGTSCDYYYRTNVGVQLTYEDANVESKNVVVTDNDKVVNVAWTRLQGSDKHIGTYTATSEGKHVIKINATDKTGNKAQEKQITFVKDVAAPSVTAVINGGRIYSESMGEIDITSNATINFSVSDANEDVNDFNYRLIKKLPDQPTTVSSYIGTQNRSFSFVDEAEYTVNAYAVDMAGNQSATREIKFRLDRTAPELSIGGASNGGTSAGVATVSFVMKESFWWDASGTVNIYRKAGDSSTESLYKTINYTPTGYTSSVSETLTETGAYRIEFDARDKVGHSSSISQTFTIDRDAPVITLTGVNNYDKTSSDVNFMAQIADDFYASKKVTVVGTREDETGKKNPIEFSSYNVAGNPTIISETFKESGIYDIEVTSEDIAGNKDVQSVHFTIDKDKPKIGKLPIQDGAVLTSFEWDADLEDLVTDLTVCKVHMYLNGSEYDGNTELEDGTYTILITAEDENGNYTDNSDSPVTFVLDTKAPTFIVTGVEDGEAKKEAYNINVSLQLEEDTLKSVTLNGKSVEITDNVATLDVTTKGKYELKMTAIDNAGNEAEQTISFTYGAKSNWWIWLIVAACVLLLAGIGVAVVKKKNE